MVIRAEAEEGNPTNVPFKTTEEVEGEAGSCLETNRNFSIKTNVSTIKFSLQISFSE